MREISMRKVPKKAPDIVIVKKGETYFIKQTRQDSVVLVPVAETTELNTVYLIGEQRYVTFRELSLQLVNDLEGLELKVLKNSIIGQFVQKDSGNPKNGTEKIEFDDGIVLRLSCFIGSTVYIGIHPDWQC